MTPEHTESTPLLYAPNASAIPIHDGYDADHYTESSTDPQEHPHARLASSYGRPSFVAGGGRGLLLPASLVPESALSDDEAFDCVRDERGLLKVSSIEFSGRLPRRESIAASAAVADVEETWEEAVKGRRIKPSWRYELAVMARYSVRPAHDYS